MVHTHPSFATTLACLHREVPAFHYMVAVAGGDNIRCAPYATFGTQALSDHALTALEGRKACLLANHGLIALGPTWSAPWRSRWRWNRCASNIWRTLQIGEPQLVDADEMDRVIGKIQDLRPAGQRNGRAPYFGRKTATWQTRPTTSSLIPPTDTARLFAEIALRSRHLLKEHLAKQPDE